MIATLERERDRMTARIDCLARNRDAVADYLDAVISLRDSGADGSGSDLGGQGELRERVDERS